MERFIKHMTDYYTKLDYPFGEEALFAIMESDVERAQTLFEADKLIRQGFCKEGLQKIVDYMNQILIKAGITKEQDRLEIIRNAIKNTLT